MLNIKTGADERKANPADVTKAGFKAMVSGEADVVAGLMNKLQVAVAKVVPSQILAELHQKMAEPGTAEKT